jgi:hypothetical protein
MPDDHSELVPPLPIPNRTVKRLHANDSADTRVKVGNRQAPHALQSIAARQNPTPQRWGFCVSEPFLVLPALITQHSGFRILQHAIQQPENSYRSGLERRDHFSAYTRPIYGGSTVAGAVRVNQIKSLSITRRSKAPLKR